MFLAQHAAVFALLLLAAAGAGTLALGTREGLALRSALGLALWGQALFLLAWIGQLRVVPLLVLAVIAIVGGVARASGPPSRRLPAGEDERRQDAGATAGWKPALLAACAAPVFLLALLPPLAFDETLYHLPFVRSLAESGELRFLAEMRFPAFPQLHELLCVPLFLLAGDTATHLVSLAEVLITAALLFEWGRRYDARAGWLAAALFAGSPIVVHLATIGYVEPALTLFVAAGFYCLDRRSFVLAGLFLGTACSVKYLGFFFALAAFVLAGRRRHLFAMSCFAAALPTTLWLFLTTRNPVFPFFPQLFGANGWTLPDHEVSLGQRVVRTLRVLWDVTFARERVNQQPPFTPFFIAAIAIGLRDLRGRVLLLLIAVYLIAFSFLPQDSRYLVPFLPLVSIAAALAMTRRPAWLAAIVAAPGILYAVWALAVRGLPPTSAAERERMLTKRIPEYAALRRAETGRIYVCGAEQLKYYARGELLGDFAGPYAFDRVLPRVETTSVIAASLRRIDVDFFLLAKRGCSPPRADGGMELVYEDAAAQLWRVQSNPSLR